MRSMPPVRAPGATCPAAISPPSDVRGGATSRGPGRARRAHGRVHRAPADGTEVVDPWLSARTTCDASKLGSRPLSDNRDDRPRRCTQLPKSVADALEPLPLLGLVPAGRADNLSRAAPALGVPLNSDCGLLAVSWDAASHRTACTLRCNPSRSCRQLMISKRLRACGLPFGLSMRIRLLGDFAVSPPSS